MHHPCKQASRQDTDEQQGEVGLTQAMTLQASKGLAPCSKTVQKRGGIWAACLSAHLTQRAAWPAKQRAAAAGSSGRLDQRDLHQQQQQRAAEEGE